MDRFLMGIVDCISIVNHSQTVKKNRSSQLSNSKVCESKILTHTGPVYDCFLYKMPFVLGMYSNSKTALYISKFQHQKSGNKRTKKHTCTGAMAQSWDGCSFSKSSMKLIHFMVKHLEHIPVQPCSKALLLAGHNAYIASWEISPGNWATSIFSEGSLKRKSFDVDVLFYYMIPLKKQTKRKTQFLDNICFLPISGEFTGFFVTTIVSPNPSRKDRGEVGFLELDLNGSMPPAFSWRQWRVMRSPRYPTDVGVKEYRSMVLLREPFYNLRVGPEVGPYIICSNYSNLTRHEQALKR